MGRGHNRRCRCGRTSCEGGSDGPTKLFPDCGRRTNQLRFFQQGPHPLIEHRPLEDEHSHAWLLHSLISIYHAESLNHSTRDSSLPGKILRRTVCPGKVTGTGHPGIYRSAFGTGSLIDGLSLSSSSSAPLRQDEIGLLLDVWVGEGDCGIIYCGGAPGITVPDRALFVG